MSSYEVRIWGFQEYQGKDRKTGKPKVTYRLRWEVAGKTFSKSFQTKAMAETFRSKLLVEQRAGMAFDELTGLPEPMARELSAVTWYDLAVAYVDLKWPRAAAKHRKSIAESLATVTPVLLDTDRGRPGPAVIRAALYGWVFNRTRRESGQVPEDLAPVVEWLQAHSVKLSRLEDDTDLVRQALDALATLLNGKPAAPNTLARKRAVFSGALTYAVERRWIDRHPMSRVNWTAPKVMDFVDRKVVVNPKQAKALLDAVGEHMPELVAFFGCMYYSALRPEEVLHLHVDEFEPPRRKGKWGWLHLSGATISVGNGWGDTDDTHEDRGLKHRPSSSTRDVPAPPQLCELLAKHLAEWPPGPNGRLFVTRRGPWGRIIPGKAKPIPNNTYTTVWKQARQKALSPRQRRSPLAARPYDLRHAAVSTWLNSGVSPTRVAEWAGHSVAVLLKIYAKCIDGETASALRRIEAALQFEPDPNDDSKDPNETDEPPDA
jgi:integrase